MLAELDLPTGVRSEILDAYGAAADELARLVEGARRRPDAKHGHQAFAIFHLVARGLTDLIAGAHLLNHCYQARSSMLRQASSARWRSAFGRFLCGVQTQHRGRPQPM
jgi:hypothetical protein